ncbi:hypothetical protein [Acinetobacter bereziniae]|jgi:hypothetical protein|uniref:hypothetical protein n=2 Tax=Acinetobacter bereziniae TaxID=106648 RepID=UPI00208FEF33|nr:hypothetical protein [Acinetobacter bereziniae]MDV8157943.1 hypothetical protein [Acinetobacter bereziniae]
MARLIFLIFLILFLQACNGINKDNSKKNEINVEKEVSYLFNGYNYDLKKGMQRGFANYYNVFIPKSDLSLSDFEIVKRKIQKKWKLVYTSDDQYVFCYDRYNQMTIIYPRKMEYYDKFGQKLYIKSSSLDKWGVSIKYIKEGTSYCKDVVF